MWRSSSWLLLVWDLHSCSLHCHHVLVQLLAQQVWLWFIVRYSSSPSRAATPARITLGVTTVLTITTLKGSSDANLPHTSYPKVLFDGSRGSYCKMLCRRLVFTCGCVSSSPSLRWSSTPWQPTWRRGRQSYRLLTSVWSEGPDQMMVTTFLEQLLRSVKMLLVMIIIFIWWWGRGDKERVLSSARVSMIQNYLR